MEAAVNLLPTHPAWSMQMFEANSCICAFMLSGWMLLSRCLLPFPVSACSMQDSCIN